MGQSGAVHDDDSHRRPAQTGLGVAPLARRLASPVGLLMAGLCLLLPFMSASCATEERAPVQWRVTYTGVDVITSGSPDVDFTADADREPIHRLDDVEVRQLLGTSSAPLPPQPLGWLAAALMTAALAATALATRTWRTTFTAGLAFAAAVVLSGATILARHDATDALAAVMSQFNATSSAPPPTVPQVRAWGSYGEIRDMFRYEYGFWIAVVALFVVGVANTVGVVRDPAHDRDRPAPAAADA
jgi:hypothetical protein